MNVAVRAVFRRTMLFRSALVCLLGLPLVGTRAASAQASPAGERPSFGPYNGTFFTDGMGIRVQVPGTRDPLLAGDVKWTMSCWIMTSEAVADRELVAGIGDIISEYPRYLAIDSGKLALWMGSGHEVSGPLIFKPGTWHLIAATFDGKDVYLYGDAVEIGAGPLAMGGTKGGLELAPDEQLPPGYRHFGGKIAAFEVTRRALSPEEMRKLMEKPPAFDVILYEEGSKPFALQVKAQSGLQAPQDASLMPVSRAAPSLAVAISRPPIGPSLKKSADGEWTFSDGWMLREAPKVDADGAKLSSAQYVAKDWMRATVPGTVLTTMIDDGVYPDSDYGMNNLLIPESLNKQDYWYRNEFTLPAGLAESGKRQHVQLTLEGINYEARVWLNGTMLGTVKGAFERGKFEVGKALNPGGINVLAVQVSPPPHPGIPHEQSLLAGAGPNGGAMMIDGPTFGATEGWDWIPAIRDRDTGIWQAVTLRVAQAVRLGDVQVVSRFLHHDTSNTALEINVPVQNLAGQAIRTSVTVVIEGVQVKKQVTVTPGETIVTLRATEFPQLNIQHPRLWWPNGYGKPELYRAKVTIGDPSSPADCREVRFGIREVSYQLSLLDQAGHLRRVEYTPAEDSGAAVPVVDVSHNGIREITPGLYVETLSRSGETSPAIERLPKQDAETFVVIKVNGVRIAARGGNWGMDDSRKRVSREHLEPFFRLHRDANLNIIRNWMGQNTEEIFYQLADEYGLMVWNDFWESSQNWNLEAEDPALYLANARETISRFRNHPSIVIWCGRNEGVPQPVINTGLDQLIRQEDGTRFYSPSSIRIDLQSSGPWDYQEPSRYYTTLSRGFTTETGTMSMPTLESFESTTPEEDRWPISDDWAYHDWHMGDGSNVKGFMKAMEVEFGAGTSLEDFERKAQMLNYVDHRAIFEGMAAHLWAPNSGRILWMTQPAWPSTVWQIMSSDYDTQASFYATKKACEPIHIQLDLATHQIEIVNTTTQAMAGLTVSAKVYSLQNQLLFESTKQADAAADTMSSSIPLELRSYLERGVVLVALDLFDPQGNVISRNVYWLGANPESYRELNGLAEANIRLSASPSSSTRGMSRMQVTLTNDSPTASLMNKVTLFGADGKTRILPAYYSDNYISLMPHESQTVEIEYPTANSVERVALRGWNTKPVVIAIDRKTQAGNKR